jgi:hypothetical protein
MPVRKRTVVACAVLFLVAQKVKLAVDGHEDKEGREEVRVERHKSKKTTKTKRK